MENINNEKIEKWIEDCPEHDTEILTTNEDGIVLVVRFNNQKTTNKKETKMNKEQRQIKKRIDQAYSKLHVLSNITWTPYRDEIFDMNKKDEKRHRFNRPSSDFEASINDCAKMFTVKNIAESLLKANQYQVKDIIRIRKSCLYSQSVVENYKDKILDAWKDEDLKYLANLDYIALIDWKHYTEIEQRKVA